MSLVDLGKQLLESARNGETEQVRNLMASGAPFTTDWLGTSPLHIAAQNGHVSTAELLLRAGISRDARTKVDRTPLHIAAQEGHLDIVELLLKHGADVDAKDMLRMTPLHWAVERGHVDVIRCLITSGANVHAVSKFEKKPADIAADCNRHDIMNLLMNMVPQTKSAQAKSVEHEKNSQVKMITPQKKTLLKAIKVELVTSGTTEKTSGGPTTTQACSTKIIPARPVQLHPNLAAFASAIATSGLNNSVKNKHCESDEDTTDQRSTSVLATLAALAEATAPSATVSTTEALQWLETHGITLLPTDTSTIVASALEGGQTITLTEAGKLALDSVRHSREPSEEQKELTTKSANSQRTSTTISSGQNLIAIVTDQSQLPTLISNAQSTPMMVVGGSAISTSSKATSLKTMEGQKVSKVTLPKATVKPILNHPDSDLRWKQLEKELEEARKEAENYRVQLQQKEQEAEQYRKQLEQIRTNKLQ